ncbi:MAG: hypothetical protein R3249_04790, partial [Nitriliruptorales bacterium]|nr:hypothetical protein [Nitriliruptorales bacterium]
MTPDSPTTTAETVTDASTDTGEPSVTDNGDHASPRPRRGVAVLGDRVLVAVPADGERRSKGGILIPATAESVDKKGIWGQTMAVGPHVRHIQTG